DAEFDLASLVALGAQPARGAARYLLETNGHLRRSLRNRYSRWASRISPADGMVVGSDESLLDPLRQLLDRERPTARSFSPTALQHFAACPYRFYLQALLRLRPRARPEPLERMDALTRGALFHEAQFELLTQLAKSRLLPMRERDIETLYNLADQTLDSVAGRFEEELAPAIPRVWASELEGLRIDVRGWIRSVVSAAEPWRPEHFELAFGLDSGEHHDPASTREDAVLTGGRRLRGSIDMVEVSTDDHPAGPGRIRVTDHKTGRALPSRRHLLVRGGETLQPLLYALVAERLLTDAERPRTVDGGRLSYCTRRGGYQTLDVRLDDEGRAAIDEVFTAVETALGEGQLPAAPNEGACTFCDYRMVCGPREEARIQRKRPEQLTALHRLRRLP
ncbi:MAG: PD-(D/E)XK nuclease family protein, partial [Acidobacteriota bacterium]